MARFLSSEWFEAAKPAIQGSGRVASAARGPDTSVHLSITNIPTPMGPFNGFLFLEARGGRLAALEFSFDESARLKAAEFRATMTYDAATELARRGSLHAKLDGPRFRAGRARRLLEAAFQAARATPTEFADSVTGESVAPRR